MFLSSTSLADASKCLKAFDYKWNQRLAPRPRDFRPVMRRGIWLHKCLEEINRGNDWRAAITPMKAWGLEHGVDEAQLDEIEAETIEIIEGYLDYWSTRGGQWKAHAIELPLQLKLGSHVLQATVDRIAENEQGLWIWEYKSTAKIPSSSWRSVDPQTALQFFLARQAGYDVQGIIFDYLVTSLPELPRWKKDGTLYANCGQTTNRRFSGGANKATYDGIEIRDEKGDFDKLVNDSLFYQRYPVFRPEGTIRETMRDIVQLVRDLESAQATGHYRRSFSLLTCPRFCAYQELCAAEYGLGREAQTLRQELFVLNDGERGEGR